MPVEETYRDILRAAVAAAGGQSVVAQKADIDQSTVSRTLNPGQRATYTTLLKLSSVLRDRDVPAPVVAIRDAAHEEWCRLGAQLSAHRPESFESLLVLARIAVAELRANPPDDAALERLRAVIVNPATTPRKKRSGSR